MVKSRLFIVSLFMALLLSACAGATSTSGSGMGYGISSTPAPTKAASTSSTQAPSTAPTQKAVIPSTGGIDWTQHGFGTLLDTQQITPGTASTVTAGPYTLQVPANAFTETVTLKVLQGNPADFQAKAPTGETPVLAFALSVTNTQGTFVTKFNSPITLTAKSSAITADSKYYNISPDGSYADNPSGLKVQAGQLTHPIAADSVAWVITAPSTTPTPSTMGGYGYSIGISNNPKLGAILVNGQGMTLYTFKKDTAGASNCNGACASLWPPLTVANGVTPTAAPGVTGKLGVITRPDGSQQVTYNGMPLYTFTGDKKAGDATGQGYLNVWYVVPASPSSSSGSGTSGGSSSTGGNGGY